MRLAALILTLGLMSGCVVSPRGDLPPDWIARTQALQELTTWSLNGRIGVTLEERGFSGALRWQQQDELLQVNVNGPLGIGAFRISGAPGSLVLQAGNDPETLLDEDLLTERLGWGVPIEAMTYWLRGLAYPVWPVVEEFDDTGQLARLDQNEWTVRYDRYMTYDDWLMPRRVVIEGRDARIKLAVQSWRFGTQKGD